MQTFTKPNNLNGTELRAELNAAGIQISDDFNAVQLDGEELYLKIAASDIEAAAVVVAAHNGTI
jgi:hypothetical protein